MSLLECLGVTMKFGELHAVKDVNFEVKENEILGLIGPNGAGKSTLFNCISGTNKPTTGKIKFKGTEITGFPPYKICHLGIGRTFQIPLPFLSMTGFENVLASALYGKNESVSTAEARDEALRHLEFVGLGSKKDMHPRGFTTVDLKRLEMARALATRPKLLLLDETAAGLNQSETVLAMQLIRRVRDELGITIFWIEHVMKAVMEVVDRIIVLDHGQKICEGTPKDIACNEEVIDAYLGKKYTT